MSVEIRAARDHRVVMTDAGRRLIRRWSMRLLAQPPMPEVLQDVSDFLAQIADGEPDLMLDADSSQSILILSHPPPASRREGAG